MYCNWITYCISSSANIEKKIVTQYNFLATKRPPKAKKKTFLLPHWKSKSVISRIIGTRSWILLLWTEFCHGIFFSASHLFDRQTFLMILCTGYIHKCTRYNHRRRSSCNSWAVCTYIVSTTYLLLLLSTRKSCRHRLPTTCLVTVSTARL